MTTTALPLTPTMPATDHRASAVTQAIDPGSARELAHAFKALADPARVQLLAIVASREGNEACVCDLTDPIGLSQPTVSHHLKILVEAGLLAREQRGRWAYYSLVPHTLAHLAAALTGTVTSGTAR